jgi:hypothetical protein
MFIWDASWEGHSTQVVAQTAIGAQKKARKEWGKTVHVPANASIQVAIFRHPDGSPVKVCTHCRKFAQWEDVMGLCEACYNQLCEQNARIPTPSMDTKTWNTIAETLWN